jgi:ELWxxDGT repeat protein
MNIQMKKRLFYQLLSPIFSLWALNVSPPTCAQTLTLTPRRIADLNPGPDGSFPSNLTAFASSLYFDAHTIPTGTELWKYDGTQISLADDINDTTADGTIAGNSSTPNWLTPFNGALYFSAFDARRGTELWRYNGTTAVRAADVNPDANDNIKTNPNSSWPSNLTVLNNTLYFTANGGSRSNYELWKFDGTTATLAANIHPDTGLDYSSYPTGLTAFNGALYFSADDGSNGYELWKYDGAKALLVTNINPGGATSSSYPQHFTQLNNYLYFSAFHPNYGYELWKTDGTNVTLIDINPGSGGSYPDFLTVFNGALYFRATDEVHGYELWKYDGSSASMVADINTGGDSFPKDLTVFGNALFFAADDGIHGWELCKYDGANATLVGDLNPSGDSFPDFLTVFNGALYFSATTPDTGYELWKYDGHNITLAADINPGPGDSFPRFFTPFGQEMVFAAAGDGASDWELWTLAPTTANQAPTVALTAPTDGANFLTTDTITLSANASDDGSVSKVEFFANGNSVGTATATPYTVSTTLAAGTYSVTAKATDNLGLPTTSAAVTVTVKSPSSTPRILSIGPGGSGYLLTVSGVNGVPEILEISSDLVSWSAMATNTPAGGVATFTDSATASQRFYRVVVH